MNKYISIQLSLDDESQKYEKKLSSALVPVEGENNGMAISLIRNSKNLLIWQIAALRDYADALEVELNRPELVD